MSDNRTTELLPCPFCGGEAEIVSLHPYEETPVGICCSRCPAIFADGTTYSGFKEYDTEAEAITAWNTRYAEVTIKGEQWEELKRVIVKKYGDEIRAFMEVDSCDHS